MKKTIKKEVSFCDKCGKEVEYPTACLGCGIEMCYDCQKKFGITYNHAVYFSGSGDGFYCVACDKKFTASGRSKRHMAYRAIRALKYEMELFHEGFRKRQEAAESALKALPKRD